MRGASLLAEPMDPLKIINIVGARPNLPKIAPLIREMQKHPNIKPILVHTGQHYDDQLSDIFFREMNIPPPDVNLGVGSGSHAAQTAEVLRGIEPVLLEYKPDIVLVVGDVNSTIAVALAASKLGIRVAHVEAGLRSFDRTMPEEINRILTDALADYLFATEQDAVDNLLKEGRPRESIFLVGNVMIDSLLCFREKALQSRIGEELGLSDCGEWQKYALLTLHRPSNVDSPENLAKLLDVMDSIATEIPIIFPVHPRTKQRIADAGNSRHPNLRLIAPLGYLDFLCLLSHATFVMTDSGGIQEETTVLGVSCLTLRENTERPVTISKGTNQLVGTDPSKISAAAKSLLSKGKSAHKIPPLWDGHAAERIVSELLK